MKYTIDEGRGTVRFDKVPNGEVFVHYGVAYMATPDIEREGCHSTYNCVKIGSGEHHYFAPEASVELPKSAELKIVLR